MSHQKGRLKNSKFWLCLSLILCLVSAIVASAVQTSGGIRIKEMSWESPSGHQLAAYLYIPQNATKDTPAPGVVTIEGWYNNKEMQDLYSIELARRGYVVLALDLHSHGDSESLSIAELYDGAVGVDGAVQLIARPAHWSHLAVPLYGSSVCHAHHVPHHLQTHPQSVHCRSDKCNVYCNDQLFQYYYHSGRR